MDIVFPFSPEFGSNLAREPPSRLRFGMTPSSGAFRKLRMLPGDRILRSVRSLRNTNPAVPASPKTLPNKMFTAGDGLYGSVGGLLGSTMRIGLSGTELPKPA